MWFTGSMKRPNTPSRGSGVPRYGNSFQSSHGDTRGNTSVAHPDVVHVAAGRWSDEVMRRE
jgi:hypothetical protein